MKKKIISFVFDSENIEKLNENLGVLDKIKSNNEPPKVIITTKAASFGVNFF